MGQFNEQDINSALAKLGTMNYFPADQGSRAEIAALLAQMCVSSKSLDWLMEQMICHVKDWPGCAEMRGIYCSRFPPMDGINTYAAHWKYSPEASEGRSIEDHKARLYLCGDVAEEDPAAMDELHKILRDALAKVKNLEGKKLAIDPKRAQRALEGLRKLAGEDDKPPQKPEHA